MPSKSKQPSWQELLQSKLDRPPAGTRTSAIRTNAAIDKAIKDAAANRNMSVTAYIRRAAVAMAVYDLGLEWDAVMSDEPGFGVFGENPGRAVIRPEGHGFGPWKIREVSPHHVNES
jgi:hypothetical protein